MKEGNGGSMRKRLARPDSLLGLVSEAVRSQSAQAQMIREVLLALCAQYPTTISRMWVTAAQCSDRKRQSKLVDVLGEFLGILPREVLAEFLEQEILSEEHKDYGGEWPGCFYRLASVPGMSAVACSFERIREISKCLQLAEGFFHEGGSCWSEVFRRAEVRDRQACQILPVMIGTLLLGGKAPIGTFLGEPKVRHIMANKRMFAYRTIGGKLKVCGVDDPKGRLEPEGIPWLLDGLEQAQFALFIVDSMLQDYRMPADCRRLVRQTGKRILENGDEICAKWGEIKSRPIRSWIAGGGLTHIEIRFGKFTSEESGMSHLVLRPGDFPEVTVETKFAVWGSKISERSAIDRESGLLKSLADFEEGSDEFYLRLVITDAVVCQLYRIAFGDPISRRKSDRSNGGSAANPGSGHALLPCFRSLPPGYKPTPVALERSRRMMDGHLPPPGQTLYASPSQEAENSSILPEALDLDPWVGVVKVE
ncbi:hypothetical protein COT77_01325 [Candidatus Berkelbacteria bacterium CG10_big_fil_rev_8_21_14_0_10_41_12]|uniref:Uncharacterized protein n=1 Tax=Candidatus Berkelbacteria bacterium CG10_big_fil_rev_8_21_14_0_10_41_12 TaxID=1974513 RepID=A0A2M6WXH2_9BACT|nr:MAG: hypothetical protein COT77_01325 [Candidatus Berkelbacteria bacterium CG10_big_fil_rev_8_21_14_0_10_41_12]